MNVFNIDYAYQSGVQYSSTTSRGQRVPTDRGGGYLAVICGIEFNGGTKKTLVVTAITTAVGLAGTGIGYTAKQVSEVQPLKENIRTVDIKVDAVDAKLDASVRVQSERKEDQKSFNDIFLENQRRVENKTDEILKALRERP